MAVSFTDAGLCGYPFPIAALVGAVALAAVQVTLVHIGIECAVVGSVEVDRTAQAVSAFKIVRFASQVRRACIPAHQPDATTTLTQ
jgi:hypothetical protein